jgi:fructose-bisphosphate aldolase, class II
VPESTTAELIADAHENCRGVAAFNVITLEHAEAIVQGAAQASRPVILQVSQNAVAYHGGALEPLAAAVRAIATAADVPAALHLDHVEDDQLLRRAVSAGFSSVMVDAGRLPYAQNVAATAAASRWLQAENVFVEAELGYVGGKDTQTVSAHAPGARTDPRQAADFVADTNVDALAVAVGSSHAMTARTATLDFSLIEALRDQVPIPLVLHGSSGVADADLQRAVRAGIVKVNIGTALNVAFTDAVRRSLETSKSVDPRTYLGEARKAVAATVRTLIDLIATS